MAVLADGVGVIVRNLGRDYQVPWECLESIEAGRSDNVSGGVTTLIIRRTDGNAVVGRGASSYSRRKVGHWRDVVLTARPAV